MLRKPQPPVRKKYSLPEYRSESYFGMADALPVIVPTDYKKTTNRNFGGEPCPIAENTRFSYGTAGFRSVADDLTFIAFRVGYLASLRARQLNKCIGVMITASHNPACDNGIKVVDPMGEMLAAEWERHATNLVNQSDEQFPTAVRALEMQLMAPDNPRGALIVCAYDTRVSGPHLLEAIKAGAALLRTSSRHVMVVDHEILTTPQIHFITRCVNDPDFGIPTEQGYYIKLSKAYNEMLALSPYGSSSFLILDCANGVGAKSMRKMLEYLEKGSLIVHFENEEGELNHDCGADFVKISQMLPASFEGVTTSVKCASLDGDADRLVYFRRTEKGRPDVNLLDGDKIAVLLTKYIKEQLDDAGLTDQLSLGIVQTAYANGASTKYIREQLHVIPICVPTGVKHLHHEASKYDIGIYFEANGHGTVCFSDKFKSLVSSNSSKQSIRRLYLISNVINEVVGDALADLLAVELVLRHFKWSMEDWETQLYQDVPNVQIKVPVADRSLFKTNWAETQLLEPEHLQSKIDETVKAANGIRSFARPSGTENIVRVYAEAVTPELAKILGEQVAELIRNVSRA